MPVKIAVVCILFALLLSGCNNSPSGKLSLQDLSLKRGAIISCGPPSKEFGSASFPVSCRPELQTDFNIGIELLHSFEYDEAEKAFAKVIDADTNCAMAYWGVAMSNLHPLWEPPSPADLQKGEKALQIAEQLAGNDHPSSDYIYALNAYYKNWSQFTATQRNQHLEAAMDSLHQRYPADKEATIFYALSMVAAADPTDKTFARQKKAGALLSALYPSEPNHPGIIHYLIHTFDYPGIASLALEAARRYAKVAPSSAHALHMPSHIFTRLGLWNECISSNIASVDAARCYAEATGIKGHWDEELHGLDYLVYAYLQKGDNQKAAEQLAWLQKIDKVSPANFKVAYSFAAIPARIAAENKDWQRAAQLVPSTGVVDWKKFPWQESITHFVQLLGKAHMGDRDGAAQALAKLTQLRDTLLSWKDIYKAKQVSVQIASGEAWIDYLQGDRNKGLVTMQLAAGMEDSSSKHPVTPGEVLPARELLGDMLMDEGDYKAALAAYEATLTKAPSRFNAVYCAALAAERIGDKEKAKTYYKQLVAQSVTSSDRAEILTAKKRML